MASVEQLEGKEVQGWLLTREIGRGADGIVYAGYKEGLEAAIKLFFPQALARNDLAAARDRLEIQRALIGKKHHPNLVEIYDGGEVPQLETLFLVMELVPGTSLDKLIGRVPLRDVVQLTAQLAEATKYLEEELDLVHRDIKPANIVISDDFQKLTLLDFGIMLPAEDDLGRLSGGEFVATLRYSPPEFVWRTEQGHADGAWRAITFYQMGATLHDMIMGKCLFDGQDTPRAVLYDSVRERTPVVESSDVDGWLVQTVQACLLKDWRQRLQFVSWDSFFAPDNERDVEQQEKRIRLRQVRNEEIRQADAKRLEKTTGPTREQQLWDLNQSLLHEVRTYLFSASIFPRCSVVEDKKSEREYWTQLKFDSDLTRGFMAGVIFTISIGVGEVLEESTKLSFSAVVGERAVASAAWTEMFTVETAFAACQQAFLDALEAMLLA